MIKQVGDTAILPVHKASCHCGAIELAIKLPEGLVNPGRCNCSICRRKGAVVARVPLADLEIIKGKDVLSLYQFNTNTAKHYFCSRCGIYTHHQRRSDPTLYSFNVGCLEGVNPYEIDEVPVGDGINHSADQVNESQN